MAGAEPGDALKVGALGLTLREHAFNLMALEASASSLRLRLTVISEARMGAPRAETATHLISIGFGGTLDEAARMATRDMILVLQNCLGISASDAYALCSMTVDLSSPRPRTAP